MVLEVGSVPVTTPLALAIFVGRMDAFKTCDTCVSARKQAAYFRMGARNKGGALRAKDFHIGNSGADEENKGESGREGIEYHA